MLRVFLLVVIVSSIDSIYQSTIQFTSPALKYQPNNNVQLISTKTTQTRFLCSAECNLLSSCRILDYDSVSKQCRLFEGDSTTGSIISSSSSISVVGTVQISSILYSPLHNQLCQSCEENRYEVCSTNTSTCQCPYHTYWDGTVCALQLFENTTCGPLDSCRLDFNLTCMSDCYGESPKCVSSSIYNTTLSSSMRFGITVAGGCNGSASTNQTILSNPQDVILGYNNEFYTGDTLSGLLVFEFNNRTGRTLTNLGSSPSHIFLDNRTSNIYVTAILSDLAYIWPRNVTIPPSGISYPNCSMYWLYAPTGITVDSVGNVYISSFICHWVRKWAPNATNGTLVAGLPDGTPGTGNLALYAPYGLALDEPNSFLYVADRYNHRIQRFPLDGSGIGVTVAGGNGIGSAVNQFRFPTDIYLSKLDGSLYTTDCFNHRIQKWEKNATYGITIAGSPTGVSGITPYLMYRPYGLAIDDEEKYLYVSDSSNNRVQRFSLQ